MNLKYIISLAAIFPLTIVAQIKPNNSTYPTPTVAAPPTPAAYPDSILVNYVRTWEAMKPFQNPTPAQLASGANYKQATAYFDGLGRPLQEVIKGASPDGTKDLVSMHVYDAFGRETINYLPYPAIPNGIDAGKFKTNPFAATQAYYQTNYTDQRPFSKTEIEPSPLNRPTKTMAPGNSWVGSGRGIEKQYLINTIADEVRIWNIGYNANIELNIPTTSINYPAGELYKNVTKDEHQKQVVEYVDKEGRVILKKVQLADNPSANHSGWLCTYYVYDDFGLLRFVIQPKAVEYLAINSWVLPVPPLGGGGGDIVAELCFRYEYDSRQRMIAKKVPGAGWVYMCYDKRDRLVYTQDANMRDGKSWPPAASITCWMATFYDELNRPTATALYASSQTQAQLQTELNNIADPNPIPSIAEGNLYRLSYTYYDNYTFPSAASFDATQLTATQTNYQLGDEVADNTGQATSTRGLVTGTKTRVLNVAGTWQTATTYYDVNGKPLQATSTNHKGGTDIVTTQYSFTGKVISTVSKHNNPASTLAGTQTTTIQQTTLYSNNFAVSTRQKINSDGWHQISTVQYDDLGKAKRKEMGNGYNMDGNAEKFFSNFSYNIRGWLTGINKADMEQANYYYFMGLEAFYKPIFSQSLSYDFGFTKNQYNGNISGSIWMHAGSGFRRSYGYDYDNANRLLSADYYDNYYGWRNSTDGGWYINDFSVKNISYDANGNIKTMKHLGVYPGSNGTAIDSMVYDYGNDKSNKLKSVTELIPDFGYNLGDFKDGNTSGDDYAYDLNGNLIMDKNKSIASIEYNYLNLPRKITVTGKGTIEYTYDATGNKVQKLVTPVPPSGGSTTTDYLGAYQYQNNELQQVAHAEGRVRYAKKMTYTGQTAEYYWNYDFYYKDHLGNIRATVTEQQDQSQYKVSTEAAVQTQELNYSYYNTAHTRTRSQIPGYTNTAEANNRVVRTLTYQSQRAFAYQTVLKVMAGDRLDLKVDYFYKPNETATDLGTPEQDWWYWGFHGLLYQMFGQMGAGVNSSHFTATQLQANGMAAYNAGIVNLLNTRNASPLVDPAKPKAYLNWVFIDEAFRQLDGEAGQGWIQVGAEVTDFAPLVQANIKVPKSGYVYIWVSNDSEVPVYFDDLAINHRAGPLLQEDDYYPFGLEMKMLGSRAAGKQENKLKYNGKELQSDFDLEWTDYGARMYDGQIGRWHVGDPLAENYFMLSPYNYSANNPILFIDPDGKEFVIYYYQDNKEQTINVKSMEDIEKLKGMNDDKGFLANLYKGFMYMKDEGVFNEALTREEQTDIQYLKGDSGSFYKVGGGSDGERAMIFWDPTMGNAIEDNSGINKSVTQKKFTGGIQSPAAMLLHEIDHFNEYSKNPTLYNQREEAGSKLYTNAEEKRVITGSETKFANKHKGKEGIRTNHGGMDVITAGPTSTQVVGFPIQIKEKFSNANKPLPQFNKSKKMP